MKYAPLGWERTEEIAIERFRQLLGVEPGRLKQFKNLNAWAIQTAVREVNALSDFGCSIEPVLAGRKVVKVRLFWWKKNPDELKAAKVGRRARLKGTVETMAPLH